jgi:predicted anti-sigma-YlaC factor YlaD
VTTVCARAREASSARLDGEDDDADRALLATHLPRCAACREHADRLAAATRHARLAPSATVPDLSSTIVREAGDALVGRATARRERLGQLRAVLTLAGLVQVVLAVASLPASGAHSGRDLAALELALGASFLVAAARPHLARGLVPVIALVALASLGTVVLEIAAGGTALLGELTHLVPVVALPVTRAIADHGDRPAPPPRRIGATT